MEKQSAAYRAASPRHTAGRRWCGWALAGLALLAIGCHYRRHESAPLDSPPDVRIPVGPIPGPKTQIRLPMNPYQNNKEALMEGRQMFVEFNCAGCHGGHGGGGMGPSLRDRKWLYGSSDAHIFSSIAEGRGKGMPAWGTRLSADQIWKIVAYIKSLRTPEEPDPPLVPPHPIVPKKAP